MQKINKIKYISPVVLFVYARPNHTQRTVEALMKNELSPKTNLIVYSDGAKSNKDESDVRSVREFIENIQGFKSVKLIQREVNYGLSNNIILGLDECFKLYDSLIILEDDIVVHRDFLNYMNWCLNMYAGNSNIWHISGWSYPIDIKLLPQIFLHSKMNCWGWGTWKKNWEFFEKDPKKIINKWTNTDIYNFNLNDTEDTFNQILANCIGYRSTWAVFWYATIVNNNGLSLYNRSSLVKNIGFDGSGTNCKNSFDKQDKIYRYNVFELHKAKYEQPSQSILAEKRILKYNTNLKNNRLSYKFKSFFYQFIFHICKVISHNK